MKTPLSRFAYLPAVSFVFSLFSLCHTVPFLPCPLLPRPLISIFLFYSLLLLFISSVLPHIRLFLLSFLHSVSWPTCLWPVLGFQALRERSGTSGKKKKKRVRDHKAQEQLDTQGGPRQRHGGCVCAFFHSHTADEPGSCAHEGSERERKGPFSDGQRQGCRGTGWASTLWTP